MDIDLFGKKKKTKRRKAALAAKEAKKVERTIKKLMGQRALLLATRGRIDGALKMLQKIKKLNRGW